MAAALFMASRLNAQPRDLYHCSLFPLLYLEGSDTEMIDVFYNSRQDQLLPTGGD